MLPVRVDSRSMLAGLYAQNNLTKLLLSFKNTLDWMNADADWAELSATLYAKKPK